MADELDAYVYDPGLLSAVIAERRATRIALSKRLPPFVFQGDRPPVNE